MIHFSFRIELGHSISRAAEVPLGNVLVNNVEAVNISGSDCLTASLWITGVNGACNYGMSSSLLSIITLTLNLHI